MEQNNRKSIKITSNSEMNKEILGASQTVMKSLCKISTDQ